AVKLLWKPPLQIFARKLSGGSSLQVHCHYSAIFLSPPFLPSFVEISNDSTKTGEKKNMLYDNDVTIKHIKTNLKTFSF
ncbi:hypothetical protein CN643_03155, partial [Parageobacillus yumthangensis]